MKKYIFIIIAFISLYSCQDVLDVKPGDTYSEADIYSNIKLTESLVTYTYNCTENWGITFNNWWGLRIGIENASDECYFHFSPALYVNNRGLMQPNNMGLFDMKWKQYYSFIGSANNFLSKIDDSPVATSNPNEVAILKAEMKYLRANCYARLINYFGGVPLVKQPFELTDDFTLPRSSYEECVDFIVSELDEANALMPDSKTFRTGTEFGKVSKVAILALKSRVLLYAASPLHDGTEDPKGALYDYTKATKWQDAANAAKVVIDIFDAANKHLVTCANATAYQKLFLTPNDELIFARPYNSTYGNPNNIDMNTLPDKAQGPVSAGGWGLSNPTGMFVEDFKMANGLRISDPGSGYNPNLDSMYIGREMRFYANILYQGAMFRGAALDYSSPGGKDRKGQTPNHFAITGYNTRKFLDESITIDVSQSPKRPYPLARLAEIYLNYAEAMYHIAGGEAAAQEYASKTAQRAGLPAITSTGDALLADIKYEREMELYFEGHRFFDLRRWKDADKIARDVSGVQWEKRVGGVATGALDVNGLLVRKDVPIIEDRKFDSYNYYLPIPRSEVEKAGLTQNWGYN